MKEATMRDVNEINEIDEDKDKTGEEVTNGHKGIHTILNNLTSYL